MTSAKLTDFTPDKRDDCIGWTFYKDKPIYRRENELSPDPYKMLMDAMVFQAIMDCKPKRAKEDPMRALTALVFLTECGPEYAEAIGWEIDPDDWVKMVLRVV